MAELDTNPETEVSPEDKLTAAFERQEQAQKAPKVEEPEEPEETEDEPEAKAEDEPEEEGEEIEVDGEKYVVPAKLKDAFLKNKDYTEKTQKVAAERKELEERQKAVQQSEQLNRAMFSKAVEIQAIDNQIEAYKNIDWQALANSDPSQAVKLDLSLRGLQAQRAKAERDLQEAVTLERQATGQRRQQMLERGASELSRDIKGWGPELSKSIAETGRSHGYSDAELEQVTPRDIKVLNKARLWDELMKSKSETAKKVADVKPVTVKTARSTQQTQSSNQLEDARQRARKTGSMGDTEDLLTKLFESKRKR